MSDSIVSIRSFHCKGNDEKPLIFSHGDHCTYDTSVDEGYT